MGCDIHTYIEYKSRRNDSWSGFGGRLNPGRDYIMFGFLAGVRSGGNPPIFKLRGLPENLGLSSMQDAYCYIEDENPEYENNCSLADAQRWIIHSNKKIIYRDEKPYKIEHPDHHSHSWLSTEELEIVYQEYNSQEVESDLELRDMDIEYEAILGAMKAFELKGYKARLVFWFDN